MDGTVRVWNLETGSCVHTLSGHTSLVGLLGISPSHLVSAAADSSLRVWDPETGELKHTLQAHTGAITCFQHDEFKVLSGSDGTLKMWDMRDGSFVRDLLTGINGVWQVVFEGRWCVAASNRAEATVLDVWDFARKEYDDEWIGEPASGLYDDSSDEDDDEDDDHDQADADAMDQDLEVLPAEPEMVEQDMVDDIVADEGEMPVRPSSWHFDTPTREGKAAAAAVIPDSLDIDEDEADEVADLPALPQRKSMNNVPVAGPSLPRHVANSEETPTRPRIRNARKR